MQEGLDVELEDILSENERRKGLYSGEYDPVTGVGAPGDREWLEIPDFAIPRQWVPRPMMSSALVGRIMAAGSIGAFVKGAGGKWSFADVETELRRLRHKHDFLFWAYFCIRIDAKLGGRVRFKLNYPQQIVLGKCERMRLAGLPINLVIVKARQWGGSTFCIFYQTWLAFKWDEFHSFTIAAHVASAGGTIFAMLNSTIGSYPVWDLGLPEDTQLHLAALNAHTPNKYVLKDQRGRQVWKTEITIGTAEEPESLRSSNIKGAHYSEVSVWPNTPAKTPESLVGDIAGGIPVRPLSMQVFESTAKMSGDYLHERFKDAVSNERDACGGRAGFIPVFIPWYLIPYDTMALEDGDRARLAEWLIVHREDPAPTDGWRDSGKHYWWLWQLGATLEGIEWYRNKRLDFTRYAEMANEAPSTWVEAFQSAGRHVFDPYELEDFALGCREPVWVGELIADGLTGEKALSGITFHERDGGQLRIWEMPDTSSTVSNRYLVSVDVGGRGTGSDWSSVRVFDRLLQMPEFGGCPSVVAEMHYHTRLDYLAFDAARLARWYDDALLVIESNTMETRDRSRDVEGGGGTYVLDLLAKVYPHLYWRHAGSEKIREGKPVMWGFQTNVKTKADIIHNMQNCLSDRLWVEPSSICIDEMSNYMEENSTFNAAPKKHDDVLMATAIGLWVTYREMPPPEWKADGPSQPNRLRFSGNATAIL